MKSINKAVENIIMHSDIPFFALQDGVLNLSAYAQKIKKQVENECLKPVKSINAIVMALSRLQKQLQKQKIVLPKINVSSVTIKHNLTELSLEKTPAAMNFVQKLLAQKKPEIEILLVTYGLNAINLVVQNSDPKLIKKLFAPYSVSAVINDLVSITLGIPEEDVMIPNIFYTILSKLAAKEINIVEITTAKLELTLILQEKVLAQTYEALSGILNTKQKLY